MSAYYNENEPKAAAWLRQLIKAGHITPGEVDERSIIDVRPSDLSGFVQCHFFAGIGVWSYALRRAGWPDNRPVWTGSCPCQPFSAAGKGGGFDDERHLWPAWFHLIGQLRPAKLFGEQVASKNADVWVDLVQADLEALGYAFGAVPFPSAGVGAPHIRDRTYWLADAAAKRLQAGPREQGFRHGTGQFERQIGAVGLEYRESDGRLEWRAEPGGRGSAGGCSAGGLDDDDDARLEGQRGRHHAEIGQRQGSVRSVAAAGEFSLVEDASGERLEGRALPGREQSARPGGLLPYRSSHDVGAGWAGPTNGLWRDADWLFCRDGKWRPVEPGTFPLAHGAPARVGRLRGYGNAINARSGGRVHRSRDGSRNRRPGGSMIRTLAALLLLTSAAGAHQAPTGWTHAYPLFTHSIKG